MKINFRVSENMITEINENIRIWQELNSVELSLDSNNDSLDSTRILARMGFNKERIAIRDRWFDVLTPSELVRSRNKRDGYYRVVYIQIDMETGEYYIGKANRPKWSELVRYQGSGLKFKNKFRKNKERFVRYYIARCDTAEETEKLESSIVNSDLVSDDKCLNLVAGGGGTSKHPSIAETSAKKREYMVSHPDQFHSMLEASKKAFRSGDTHALRARNQRIKEVMNDEKYREMTRERITKWKRDNPEEYARARKNNHNTIKDPKTQEKRKKSFEKWVEENPEKYAAWQDKLIKSRTSEEANKKRRESIKEWAENNPGKANKNSQKRAEAAAAKLSKEICMVELGSGRVLQIFPSQHAAADWLVNNNKTKNKNCVSSISAVCLRKPCTTGYGYRKKAYGYDWRFAEEYLKSQKEN